MPTAFCSWICLRLRDPAALYQPAGAFFDREERPSAAGVGTEKGGGLVKSAPKAAKEGEFPNDLIAAGTEERR